MQTRDAPSIDAMPDVGQNRGQECQRDEDAERHDDRGGQADSSNEGNSDREEPEQRYRDYRAGEGYRAAGGVDRTDDRLLDSESRAQSLAVARDDEERIVDADAQADHRGEGRGEAA